MTLKLRGQIQIQDASIELSKIKDISSGTILGRPEEASSNYDAENAAPAGISGEDIRRIAELHIDDNVHFSNLQAAAVTAASATLAGDISAANATLSADLSAANATLSGDLSAVNATLSADLSAVAGTFSSNISAVDATLSGDLSAADATLSGDLAAANATFSADLSAANATLSGNLSAVGGTFSGNTSAVDGTFSGDIAAADATLSGDLSAVAGTFSGNISAVDATMSGDIAAADATLSGDLSAVNATLSGDMSATGDVSGAAATFSGALSAGASTLGAISAPSAAITNAVSAGSIASSGILSSAGKATLNSLEVTNDADILGATAITGALSAASAEFSSETGGWADPVRYENALTALDANAKDFFGSGVGLSADGLVLAVGASLWEGDSTDQGGVYIYDWDSTNKEWDQRGSVITAPDAANTDRFGESTSLNSDGTIMATGAMFWDDDETNQGAAYVFEYIDGSWSQKGSTLSHDNPTAWDLFTHVSISGNGLVLSVGVYAYDGSTGTDQGAVYVYDWNASTNDWDQRGSILLPSDPATQDYFGRDTSLSNDGSVLAVGAAYWEGDTTNQGGVYIYDWKDTDSDGTADAWVQRGNVLETSATAVSGDQFGFSCQLNSDASILVVSKYQYSNGGGDEGEVEIYDWNSETSAWDLRFTISNPNASASGTKNPYAFGYKVSIDGDGDVLVISERGSGRNNFAGRVQTYKIELAAAGGSLVSGAATLASAAISGDISADNATFSSDASAANAAFSGTLSAGASTLASATIAGAVSAGSFSSSSVNIDGGSIDGTAIGETSRSSGKFSIVDITSSMTVGGDLTVSGDTTTIDTTNLIIKDPMIQMGEGNATDAIDLGFIGQYDSSKYAGLVRDADDSGKFKLFYTDEDLSTAQTVDFAQATKATLDADIKGDIQYDDAKEWSISGDIAATAVSYDGTGNVELSAVIQSDTVEFSMLDCKIDENDMASNSSSHVPTQSSVKAYVDAQVASAGLDNPEPTVFLIVDSTTSYVGAKQIRESVNVDINNTNGSYIYVDITVAADAELDELSQVFLNGKKLRFSEDEATREYYFSNDDSSEYKRINITNAIIEDEDIVEVVYFVRT